MKKYICTICVMFIVAFYVTTLNAQNNRISVKNLTESQLKGLNSKSQLSLKTTLLNQEAAIRNIKESKKKYDAVFSSLYQPGIAAASSDSAVIYLWNNTDWALKYRGYYTFGTTTIEVLQEKLSQAGNSWNNYSKRVLEFYNSGSLKKETDYFWQSPGIQWLPAYVEEYNSFGRNIELYSKNWNDTTERFTGGSRIASTYLNDTLLSAELFQNWEVATNLWRNVTRTENTYANQLITKTTQRNWRGTDWVNDYSIEYTYSQFGDLLTETGIDWDTIANVWVNDAQTGRTYNSLGNTTGILSSQWSRGTSAWVNRFNQIINYDAQFRVSSMLTQKWNVSSWTDSLRASYSYNTQGQILQYLDEVWNGSAWINVYREVYTYESDKVTIRLNNWNPVGSVWENDIQITYNNNSLGYITTERYEYWNSALNIYETGYYNLYDTDGNTTEHFEKTWIDSLNRFTEGIRVLYTYYTNEAKNIKETILQEWDPTISGWKNLQKTVYFWSDLVSVKPVNLPGSFKIYPIPFADVINIENITDDASPSALKIIDLSGRIMYETELADKMSAIDLSHLPKGVYFAEINSKEGKSVIKIMKY